MKRLIAVALALITALTLVSCGQSEKKLLKDLEDTAEGLVLVDCAIRYENAQSEAETTEIKKNMDGSYTVTGYVECTHPVYNATFKGDFMVIIAVDDKGDFNIEYYDLEEPRKI